MASDLQRLRGFSAAKSQGKYCLSGFNYCIFDSQTALLGTMSNLVRSLTYYSIVFTRERSLTILGRRDGQNSHFQVQDLYEIRNSCYSIVCPK